MKRTLTVVLVMLAFAGFAAAQITQPSTDVLGAHLNYGRGCAACHTPHSGSSGSGQSRSAGSSNTILWGEDVSALYGKTITTGAGKYVEVLPSSMSATTTDVSGMLTCLGCHDGKPAAAHAFVMNAPFGEACASCHGTGDEFSVDRVHAR